MSYKRKTQKTRRGLRRKGLWTVCRLSTLPLPHSVQQLENFTSSRIWTCKSRGVRNSPTSGMRNAKCVHVSINSNKSMHGKPCGEHTLPNMKEASSDGMYRSDKTNYTGSVDRFMRLIPRGDNPNKETLIYISYASCLHRLSTYNDRGETVHEKCHFEIKN